MITTNRPPMPIVVLASAARTSSSNSGSLKDTATAWPTARNLTAYLNLTAFTGSGIAATLDVIVDTSPDNGTTWLAAGIFSRITTSTAVRQLSFRDGLAIQGSDSGVEEKVVPRTLNTTTTREAITVPLTRDVRVRWALADNVAVGDHSATFGVYLMVDPD